MLNFYKLWPLGGSPSHRMVMGKKKTKKKFIQISELSGIALTSMELHLNYWLLYVGCYMHGNALVILQFSLAQLKSSFSLLPRFTSL